jgi:hypothetical protein
MNAFSFDLSIIKHLIDEYKVDPNAIISNSQCLSEKKIYFYTEMYIDLDDYLSVYLSGGHMPQSELDNPLDLKADTDDKKFFCINAITVSPSSSRNCF